MTDQHKERRMSEGPFRVEMTPKENGRVPTVRIVGPGDDGPATLYANALGYSTDEGSHRFWCDRLSRAYLAGLAASPTPPPTGERPWERLEARHNTLAGSWQVVGSPGACLVAHSMPEHCARALADAYNAHRPQRKSEPPQPCAECKGSGSVMFEPCVFCGGSGYAPDNAHRPASTTPDAEAIAREAVDGIKQHAIERGQFNAYDATRIIADAIRKGRGEP